MLVAKNTTNVPATHRKLPTARALVKQIQHLFFSEITTIELYVNKKWANKSCETVHVILWFIMIYYDLLWFIISSYWKFWFQEEVWIVLCAAQPSSWFLNPIYYAFLFSRQTLRNHSSRARPTIRNHKLMRKNKALRLNYVQLKRQ